VVAGAAVGVADLARAPRFATPGRGAPASSIVVRG
jgi:hypothetical protein